MSPHSDRADLSTRFDARSHAVHFADAYLVAEAEISGVNAVASFDKAIERVPTVRRVEP